MSKEKTETEDCTTAGLATLAWLSNAHPQWQAWWAAVTSLSPGGTGVEGGAHTCMETDRSVESASEPWPPVAESLMVCIVY